MRIVQVAPEIGPGTGVGTVAYELEREWTARGHDVRRFVLADARGGWLPSPGPGVRGKLALALRVVWFSTVGTLLARRHLRAAGDVVSVCHNDALAGDVYVNHGLLTVAMRARGHAFWRLARNPMHAFIVLRDRHRYASGTHAAVVNLVSAEEAALRSAYPVVRTRTVVIGNGVDVDRFAVASADERASARAQLGLAPEDVALLFVGHEYGRKGLPVLLDVLDLLPSHVRLVVVGGTSDMVAQLERTAAERGLAGRVLTTGRVDDPRPYFAAADLFTFPSAYESYGLVVVEALASGLPVVATPVGCVPDVVLDDVTGAVAPATAPAFAAAIDRLLAHGVRAPSSAAREAAQRHTWGRVAEAYLDLLTSVHEHRTDARRKVRA